MTHTNRKTTIKNRLIAGALATMTLASVSTLSVTTASATNTVDDDILKALSSATVISSNISAKNPNFFNENTGFKPFKLGANNKAVFKTNTEKSEIDNYINSLKENNKVTVKDYASYMPVINGMEFSKDKPIDKKSISNDTFVTTVNRLSDGKYFDSQKRTSVLAGVGEDSNLDYIFPGNIMMIEESSNGKTNVYEGKYRNMDLAKRASGVFVINNDTDKEFIVEDMSNHKDKKQTRACDEIQDNMYEYLGEQGDISNYYVIRIASATSPEQLSASLNMSESAINAQVSSDDWEDIRSGKKQVSVVSVQQIVATVEMKNDLTYPSDLFSKDATVKDIQKISKDGNSNAMLITKVNYGREYIMTAELNLRNTAMEEHTDLTSGLIKLFRSHSDFTTSETNALKYAKVNASEIGYSSINWTDCEKIHSIADFIKHLSKQMEYKSDLDNLVPVSYEALNLAGSLPKVMMDNQSHEYKFKGVSADKISGLTFRDDCDGKSCAREYWSYGIDIDEYNKSGQVVEKAYKQIASDVDNYEIPAYQCIYGVSFDLSGGVNGDNGNAHIFTENKTRLYQNAGFKYEDDNGNKISENRIDLSNMSLVLGVTHRSVGYNRNYIELSFDKRDNTKLNSDLTRSSFKSNAAGKSGSGWNGCWVKFSYDNELDINGNGLKLNNKAVDNT